MTRRAVVLSLLTGLFLAAMSPAHAAGYRYWSFWDRTGTTWTYATQGPSTAVPSDGDVQGFRFAVSKDSASAVTPRGTASFGTICANTPALDGHKRLALVLDFGTPADAPPGEVPPSRRTECASVPRDATTAEALAAVAKPLRYGSNALLCAIAGYPEAGCGEQVAQEEAGSGKSRPDGGPSVGLLAGSAAIVALGAAAVWQARRRRRG
ncbi:SCO2322 family protein [Streptomyces sp. NBC_00285]|uniref:SCO2322 family protein n=1 Tax=Streptomyces sp. NBC_00285 TaxID=2975700 RepID=UPI002E2DD5EE|nr:SCO2322 family protein [Streptomyces sp. NBC_00285]